MKDPKKFRDAYRTKVYIASVLLVVVPLLLVATVNWRNEYIAVSVVEFVMSAMLLLTIPLARKGKHLEIFGNLVSSLGGAVMLFNATHISGSDPGPYIGLFVFLICSAMLTVRLLSFYVYNVVVMVAFMVLLLAGRFDITAGGSIKFFLAYGAVVILFGFHKKYLDMQSQKMYQLAKELKLEGVGAEIEATQSSKLAAEYKKQQQQLKEQNKKLAQKQEELEKLNEVMIGRELKMAEMKEQIDQQKQ